MENGLLHLARLARATAPRVVPPRLGRRTDPTCRPASLQAAPLPREHLRLTYRTVEDLLRLADRLWRMLRHRIVPDDSTLWWFGRRHFSPRLLAAVVEASPAVEWRRRRGHTAAASCRDRGGPGSQQRGRFR